MVSYGVYSDNVLFIPVWWATSTFWWLFSSAYNRNHFTNLFRKI